MGTMVGVPTPIPSRCIKIGTRVVGQPRAGKAIEMRTAEAACDPGVDIPYDTAVLPWHVAWTRTGVKDRAL
jgi:hypothetical protein